MRAWRSCLFRFLYLILLVGTARAQKVDLLKLYPTQLTSGDLAPDHARPWDFTDADLFRVSRFRMAVGSNLKIEVGLADLGIGHCTDGAVWAVLIPQTDGQLTSTATNRDEPIAHVWLRFHPGEITRLFPPETVSAHGSSNLAVQMRAVANFKMTSSYQAGGNAMIPEPKSMTVDVDTKTGARRFFVVDDRSQTAEYEPFFADRAMKPPPPITSALAEAAFDQLWSGFDRDYAMFTLRPEVDWAKMREQYRPQALNSKSTPEFTAVCAEMLKSPGSFVLK